MAVSEMDELILLKQRVVEMLGRYEKLREELSAVRMENSELRSRLENKETEVNTIKNNFDRVKLSGAIRGDEGDTREARQRVNRLVREIDNCIALLNNI